MLIWLYVLFMGYMNSKNRDITLVQGICCSTTGTGRFHPFIGHEGP